MTITPTQLRASAARQRAAAPDGATVPLADELEAAATEIECLSRPATWQEEQMGVEAAFERSGVTRPWPADEPDQLVPMADAMADEIARLRLTDSQREAVETAALAFDRDEQPSVNRLADVLRGIVDRPHVPLLTAQEREAVEYFAETRKPLARLCASNNREQYVVAMRGLLARCALHNRERGET